MPKPKASAASITPEGTAMASKLVDYINESWTPWHAVAEASKRLLAAGFEHISETAEWNLKPGGKYFFTRNMSTVVAFAVGEKYAPGHGFYMVGAHTDSPCLKLKPVSKSSKAGCLMVNVETYGGGLWYTWFDRDLSIAGEQPCSVILRPAVAVQTCGTSACRMTSNLYLLQTYHSAGSAPSAPPASPAPSHATHKLHHTCQPAHASRPCSPIAHISSKHAAPPQPQPEPELEPVQSHG